MITQVSDIQKPQTHGTSRHHSIGPEKQVENEPPPLRRLDGQVEKTEEAKGVYENYETFMGELTIGGGEGTVGVEKVSLSLTVSILLTALSPGDPSNI